MKGRHYKGSGSPLEIVTRHAKTPKTLGQRIMSRRGRWRHAILHLLERPGQSSGPGDSCGKDRISSPCHVTDSSAITDGASRWPRQKKNRDKKICFGQ